MLAIAKPQQFFQSFGSASIPAILPHEFLQMAQQETFHKARQIIRLEAEYEQLSHLYSTHSTPRTIKHANTERSSLNSPIQPLLNGYYPQRVHILSVQWMSFKHY